jgi:hypothetical protein
MNSLKTRLFKNELKAILNCALLKNSFNRLGSELDEKIEKHLNDEVFNNNLLWYEVYLLRKELKSIVKERLPVYA